MSSNFRRDTPTRSASIHAQLTHPVVDGDAHMIEHGPLFFERLGDVAGPAMRDRFIKDLNEGGWDGLTPDERRRRRINRPSAWTLPTRNTLDRATAMLPQLFRARMDDFGLDFSIVYSTMGLGFIRYPDAELRRALCRALNTMAADMYRGQADRMTPVATIPAYTPQEAIDELEYAVRTLGFKAVMVASNVRRKIDATVDGTWMDTLCMESPYDYDPVWAKCAELKVAVTAHAASVGFGSRVCSYMYIHNHVGSFAAAGEAFAKALVLGGVTKRFPNLNFAFLEGGVAWASELYAGLVGHCGKRNPSAIGNYDPHNLDRVQLADLMGEFGDAVVSGRPDPSDSTWLRWPGGWHAMEDQLIGHELDALGITSAEDLRPLFERTFYFGCEADDPLVSVGFDSRLNPFGARLRAMFSSDIGHWDVPDMNDVLEEAYQLVEHGLLDMNDFKEFTFTNAALLHAKMNPNFFQGTVVADAVAELLTADGTAAVAP
jgi:predicted TIM-barrel fold metal-dependent hydrolase